MKPFQLTLSPKAPDFVTLNLTISEKSVRVVMWVDEPISDITITMDQSKAFAAAIAWRHRPPSQKASLAQILECAPVIMEEFKKGYLTRQQVEIMLSLMC